MEGFKASELEKLENIELTSRSTIASILNKYPAAWVDDICKTYDVNERLKSDKVNAIEKVVIDNMEKTLNSLSIEARQVLKICIENNGVVKYAKLDGFEDDTSYFSSDETSSPVAALRRKAIMFVGKNTVNGRRFKVAFIPSELIEPLKKALALTNSYI